MRANLTTLLLTICIMQVCANGFAQKITLNRQNISLKQLFRELKKQTGYRVFYSDQKINDQEKFDANFKNVPLEQVLDHVLEIQNAKFSIKDKTIIVKKKETSIRPGSSKNIDVVGRVTDEEGRPLVGATVTIAVYSSDDKKNGDFSLNIQGKKAITVTDDHGVFYLKNVNERSHVFISYTGYDTYEIKVDPDLGTIKMSLSGNLKEVNVTINTGYQTIARERSAGAIAKPDMGILKDRSSSMNVIQRLDGLVPGIVINNSASPTGNFVNGERRGSVLIRGLSTVSDVTNRDPLFVVNGIQVTDINTLNPNDVEDITVLKDATSASIWGAKAANGVIVITTKKGRLNEKLKINYNGFVNFQGKPDLAYRNMLNSGQYIQAAKEIFDPLVYANIPIYFGQAPVSPHEMILINKSKGLITADQANQQLNALASQNNLPEIKDLWYRNSILMNHTLSVSGGGNSYSFYGSGTYTNTKDNSPGSKNSNYGLNLRQDFRFNDRIKMYLITDFLNNVSSSLNMESRPDAGFLPYAMFKNTDGSNADMSWMYRTDEIRAEYENKSLISLKYNPLDEINTGSTKNNLFKGAVTSGVTVNMLKGLRYEGVFGYSRTQNKATNFLSQENYLVRSELTSFTIAATSPGGMPTYLLPNTGGQNTVTNILNRNWTVRNQLVYENSWKDKQHQIVFLAGQEAQEQFFNSTMSRVRGYDPQLLSYVAIDYKRLAEGIPNTVMPNNTQSSFLATDFYRESESIARITSYYANGGYTYADKYSLNAGIRIDQSNLFGKDKSAQNRPVWSSGLAWQIGKEDFIHGLDWVDKLVLRGSYGITGNSPDAGAAASKDIFITKLLSLFPGGVGLDLSSPANRALTWETTKNLNIGLDFAVFKSRLSGTLDIYRKKTEDLIGNIEVNPFTGFTTATGNAGDMVNKGIDLSLRSVNLVRGNLKWTTLLTLSFNKNKINSLRRTTPIVMGSDKINQPYLEGFPAFSVFAYTYAGLDQMGDPQIKLHDGTITKEPNTAKAEDVKYMGSFQPKWSGGLSNSFGYKAFSLQINAVYNLGYVMRRDVDALYSGRNGFFASAYFNGNVNAEFVNRWKKPGDEAITNIPAYVPSTSLSDSRRDVSYYTLADINILDASYIKLRDITLSYSLPKLFCAKLKADAITFNAQISNIMLWKANHVGIDPEFQNALGGTEAGGIRTTPFNQHTITLGARISL